MRLVFDPWYDEQRQWLCSGRTFGLIYTVWQLHEPVWWRP